jgi:hypothetical protein
MEERRKSESGWFTLLGPVALDLLHAPWFFMLTQLLFGHLGKMGVMSLQVAEFLFRQIFCIQKAIIRAFQSTN